MVSEWIAKHKWSAKEFLLVAFFRWFHKNMKYPLIDHQDSYFWNVETVVHAGAHFGEERINYLRRNLNVFWIEAVPETFGKLVENLRFYPKQFALNCTLTDKVGLTLKLNVANQSACSSILDIVDEKAIPDVHYINSLEVKSETLDNLIESGQIFLSTANLLLVDTQGAELLTLKGCERNLKQFEYIILEAQDFELYAGQGQTTDIESFLMEHGFTCINKVVLGEFLPSKRSFELIFRKSLN